MKESDLSKLKKQLQLIMEAVSSDTYNLGDQFFESIVIKLNEVLDADYTFVGRLLENNYQVETLSITDRKGIIDNFTYDLEHTPCENVIGQNTCVYTKDIAKLFPEDQLLLDLGIEAYVGVPLFDSKKNPLGILVCLFKNRIKDTLAIESILLIFASRASAEMQHMVLFNSLEKHKKALELKVKDELDKKQELVKAINQRDALRDAVNNSSLVSLTDLRGKIVYANEKFIEVSKYPEDELIGANHRVLNSGHHPSSFWIEMWKCISHGEPWRQDVKNKAKDGSYYWVDTSISPVRDPSGKIVQYLSVRNLISYKKRLEENREKLLGNFQDFAFTASHKIRGPLTRITGLLNLINNKMLSEDEFKSSLKDLSEASDEMDEVIHEMVSTLSENGLDEIIDRRAEQ